MAHSSLLKDYLIELAVAEKLAPSLDLACGNGRNGRYLVSQGLDVVFADIKPSEDPLPLDKATFWQVDFEQPSTSPLTGKSFSSILVFNYLHRPLMASIKQAIQPGGLIVYETFTTEQPQFGRPTNPKFLLKPKELLEHFDDWQVLHYFEGIVDKEDSSNKKAIAQIVARKPL
ncbi:class I SAM-dependent methyltransferase [Thalassotalea crassostreae]|uniref:class I SAM-dependent methyltransferase n=1 Tax=Thalassotalea crassostreae TaxID=1763536 RepID=UPI000838E8CE|nr:methyltransferase domain-containing protein [Thalassotalea crassostreae]